MRIAACLLAVQTPVFEVVSVKPSAGGRIDLKVAGARLVATRATARMLIRAAYRLQDFQISGAPRWADEAEFDLDAKAAAPIRDEEAWTGLQTVLAERFHFAFHRETKERSVFVLVPAKGGLRLTKVADAPDGTPNFRAVPGPAPGTFQMISPGASIGHLAAALSAMLGTIVEDRTGESGRFAIHLDLTRDQMRPVAPGVPGEAADAGGPSLAAALREQLGIQIESRKVPVEVLVVDRIERPSEN